MFLQCFLKEFVAILREITLESDNSERNYKEAFRVFYKNKDGCIPTEEIRWGK